MKNALQVPCQSTHPPSPRTVINKVRLWGCWIYSQLFLTIPHRSLTKLLQSWSYTNKMHNSCVCMCVCVHSLQSRPSLRGNIINDWALSKNIDWTFSLNIFLLISERNWEGEKYRNINNERKLFILCFLYTPHWDQIEEWPLVHKWMFNYWSMPAGQKRCNFKFLLETWHSWKYTNCSTQFLKSRI